MRLLSGKFREQELVVEEVLHKDDRQEELTDTNHAFQADIVASKKLATSSRRKRKVPEHFCTQTYLLRHLCNGVRSIAE